MAASLKNRFRRVHGALVLLLAAAPAFAAEVDLAKLPPVAPQKVEFDRDIKPIFETTCLRCHGPERPKSGFRLDNREAALKGGDNGVDILPGESAKSPLIHYVARLVEDMEMPPPGKGEPLTPQQVGLLRAWIDQGAAWGITEPIPQVLFSATPTLRWIAVDGNRGKFREIEGIPEGFGGGLEHFVLEERFEGGEKFIAEGRILYPEHDFRLKLSLEKPNRGFVRGGYEQWRRYYDETGGYYRPYLVPSMDLPHDLHLDIGRAYFDIGLTLPDRPQIVVGYEYQFREGNKSTLQWGPVLQIGETNNIYPASKEIDERVHIAKLDLTHEFSGWRLEDSARVEIYDSSVKRNNAALVTLGPLPETAVKIDEGLTHVQGMNSLRMERQVYDWWLLSGGYLYSRLEGEASYDQVTVGSLGPRATFWSADEITLKRESHIFSLGSLFLPLEWLSASAGFQSEWTRQEAFGDVHLDEGDPLLPQFYDPYPARIESDLDKQKLSENVLLRFTKIPWTVLFAEARFDQESIGQSEDSIPESGFEANPEITFLRDTDYYNHRRELRAGFNLSPLPWLSLNAHYKTKVSDSDYDTEKTNSGYPGFIRNREINLDGAQAKLVLRPNRWLKTTLTYQVAATDWKTRTDPVQGGVVPEGLLAANQDAHVYGIITTITPAPRLRLSGTFTYSDSRIRTPQSYTPSVVPYDGDVYALIASAGYALSAAVDLHTAYSFSHADYGQDNVGNGLPLGLNYTRHGLMVGTTWRLTKSLSSNLRYGFYQYSEPTAGRVNDYTAHGIFATLMMKWL